MVPDNVAFTPVQWLGLIQHHETNKRKASGLTRAPSKTVTDSDDMVTMAEDPPRVS